MQLSGTKLQVVLRICLMGCTFLRGAPLRAQDNSQTWIGAPIVGLLSSAGSAEVRPIFGVPDSSTLGEPAHLPAYVRSVYLAPTQPWAVVEQARGTVGILRFTDATVGSIETIAEAMGAPNCITFSPSGRAAVLVSYASKELQVLTSLDTTPRVGMVAPLPDFTDGSKPAIAVSDDGTLVTVLNGDGRVFLLAGTGAPQVIFQTVGPADLSFLFNQATVVIADSGAATISVIGGLPQFPSTTMVTAGPNLSIDRIFIEPSVNSESVFVASAGGKSVYRFDLSAPNVASLDVPVEISRLERLRDGDVFLLSEKAEESPWLLLSDGPNLRATFVQVVAGPPRRTSPRHGS